MPMAAGPSAVGYPTVYPFYPVHAPDNFYHAPDNFSSAPAVEPVTI